MLRRVCRVLVLLAASFLILSVFFVVLYREVPPPATPLMLIRAAEGNGIAKEWRPLDVISPHLARAVMAGEDAKFCLHHGFDWDAIGEAWRRYRRGEGKLRGASTISMQTAKNVFLWPGRDWVRKGFEAYFTALIELAWGKARIIEMYLNVVEWGPGIYGAEAASQFHFHKPARGADLRRRRHASPPSCPTRSNGRRAAPTVMSPAAAPSFARRWRICRCRRPLAAGWPSADGVGNRPTRLSSRRKPGSTPF